MPRKTADAGSGNPLRPPSFGGLLRKLRDERRVSREKLAFAAGVSASYITHLEAGDREHPTRSVVDALIGYLDRIAPLGVAERRHLFDLAGLPAHEYPSVEQLREGIGADMRGVLAAHEPNPACYLDTRWNVLFCNDSYAAAFPGIVADGNLLHWFFGNDASRRVVIEWRREAALTVAWLRGLIGQSGDTTWSAELLRDLGAYPEFRAIWSDGGAAYGRDTARMHLRRLDSGAPYSLDVQMFRIDSGGHPGRMQFFLGLRTPRAAADIPAVRA